MNKDFIDEDLKLLITIVIVKETQILVYSTVRLF